MPGRWIPSAGCLNCRKAKKLCGLEQPACARCIKQGKQCSGFRDTSQLHVRDQTELTRERVMKREKTRQRASENLPSGSRRLVLDHALDPVHIMTNYGGNRSSSNNEQSIDYNVAEDGLRAENGFSMIDTSSVFRSKPETIAINYFVQHFTSDEPWEYLQNFAQQATSHPCLALAMQACGMAALANVQFIPRGSDYAQLMYTNALRALNESLRDPGQAISDDNLVVVALLGYYENIVGHQRRSVESWEAHTYGATQMLRLRGKAQFEHPTSRMLFREFRSQIFARCLWSGREAPSFLEDYQEELTAHTSEEGCAVAEVADGLSMLSLRFTRLRAALQCTSDAELVMQAAEIEQKLIELASDAISKDSKFWGYEEVDVDESEHIWDGRMLEYSNPLAALIWNKWRLVRIMLSRTQEALCRKVILDDGERERQTRNFRSTRRRMADEICATVPTCLGHPGSKGTSSGMFLKAYQVIWPLFHAAVCTLDRLGTDDWSNSSCVLESSKKLRYSTAYAQAAWILGRLDYITSHIGLKWAEGIASPLRKKLQLHRETLISPEPLRISETHIPHPSSTSHEGSTDTSPTHRESLTFSNLSWPK